MRTLTKIVGGGICLTLLAFPGCKSEGPDNLAEIKERVEKVENRLDTVNNDLASLNAFVRSIKDNVPVSSVELTKGGATVIFNGETSVDVTSSASATAVLTAKKAETDGNWYWVLTSEGKSDYLLDDKGGKVAAGESAPLLDVDSECHWLISYDGGTTYTSLVDSEGMSVEASEKNGIFKSVAADEEYFHATLADGQVLDLPISNVQDLSENGTSNCYIVTASGDYSFNASVIGNGVAGIIANAGYHTEDPAISPVSARLLWQDYYADGRGLISKVSLKNGAIEFTVPEPFVTGNAVIAACDADDNIIWSWHIWLSDVDFTQEENVCHYDCEIFTPGFDVMDRNLGATSVTPKDYHAYGLHYQWGRKDPFITTDKLTYYTEFKDAGPFSGSITTYDINGERIVPVSVKYGSADFSKDTWACVKAKTVGTIENTIKYPMNFLATSSAMWLASGTGDALWGNPNTKGDAWPNPDQGKKSIYDPCPVGWRVGPAETFRVFTSLPVTKTPYAKEGSVYGYEFYYTLSSNKTTWFPANAYRLANTGCISVSRSGGSWTNTFITSKTHQPNYFSFFHPEPDDTESPAQAVFDAMTKCPMGEGVRCVREN